MKQSIIVLLLILLFTSAFSSESNYSAKNIENKFRQLLPKEIVYTEVPRGLIISVEENILFEDCQTEIKPSSLVMLNNIAKVLKELPNYCVIENHIEQTCGNELENWELSMIRSANIVDYLIKNNKLPHEQLFDVGYGEYMPFDENINTDKKGFNNRVDFVIINYEAKR